MDGEYGYSSFSISFPNYQIFYSKRRAKSVLVEKALSNLGNGGRGIGNIVESLLINPLARYLFDEEIKGNVRITINDIDAENMPYALSCVHEVI